MMRQLSPSGQQTVSNLAGRYGFSVEAVSNMLDAVLQGQGSMAQFSHPEFGGAGQWMQGGMLMLSDMFNHTLKGRVDGLCNELSALVRNQADLIHSGSFQSQSQGAGGQQQNYLSGSQQQQNSTGPTSAVSLFIPNTAADWWGPSLRWPNSTGAQNGVRYAYFSQARRLAIEVNGHVTIYDTLDHQVGGFAQQQGCGESLTFSSQYGVVNVTCLPVVEGISSRAVEATTPMPIVPNTSIPTGTGADIFALIERLADLCAKGIINNDEFTAKKAELLQRI